MVLVVGTYRYHRERNGRFVGAEPHEDRQRRACFEDIDGRYLSELTHAAWFPAPIKARGTQGRWQIDVPDDYLPMWAKEAA